MSVAKLTSKGQITLPKEIREAFLLETGDKIDFHLMEPGVAIVRPVTWKVDDMFGCLADQTNKSFSVEEMNEGVRTMQRGSWQ